MRSQQPPRVATWLAQRLVSGPRRESLLGDLIEQYRQGRSRSWYWRQGSAVQQCLRSLLTRSGEVRAHCRRYAAPILRCPVIASSNAYRSARVPSPWDSASGMMFGCRS
jgi:hypothetical protein